MKTIEKCVRELRPGDVVPAFAYGENLPPEYIVTSVVTSEGYTTVAYHEEEDTNDFTVTYDVDQVLTVLASEVNGPMTVRQLINAFLDLSDFDGISGLHAVVQVSMDGETFYGVEGVNKYWDGGVVLQLVPLHEGEE